MKMKTVALLATIAAILQTLNPFIREIFDLYYLSELLKPATACVYAYFFYSFYKKIK